MATAGCLENRFKKAALKKKKKNIYSIIVAGFMFFHINSIAQQNNEYR